MARFRFDLSELQGDSAPSLKVLRPELLPPPPGAEVVRPQRRPWWLPALPPVFSLPHPIRVEIGPQGAAAAAVSTGLAGLLASAGAECGVWVIAWETGWAAGVGRPAAISEQPGVQIAVCGQSSGELEAARSHLWAASAGAQRWLVLEGWRRRGGGWAHLEPARSAGVLLHRLPAPSRSSGGSGCGSRPGARERGLTRLLWELIRAHRRAQA